MSHQVIELRHLQTGATARIALHTGFNCFDLRLVCDSQTIDVLWSEDGFAEGRAHPALSGLPILFPFPGRLPGTSFDWEGKTYEIPAGDSAGNAIHGFVFDRPWRLVSHEESSATAEFQASVDAPDVLERWPTDFKIVATYRLSGDRLTGEYVLSNPSARDLPFGFGAHPYFRLPIGGREASHCVVRLPVTQRRELVNMLPTGNVEAIASVEEYEAGLTFADINFDDVFTGLKYVDGQFRSSIFDPDSERTFEVSFDDAFQDCVVYTPPHRSAICIEPYSNLPGHNGVGSRLLSNRLASGQSMSHTLAISLR